MVPLARRYLLAEKLRTSMSIAGVAFAVLLVMIVTGLYRGWSASSAFFAELPGDVWIAQSGTSDPLRSSSFVPTEAVTRLARVPGVAAAIPVLARRVSLESSGGPSSAHLMSFDMSFDMSNDVPDGLRVDERDRFVPGPGGIVIDRVLADELTVDIGDAVDVLGERLEVRRIEPGGNPLFAVAFVDTSDAERFLALDGYVNFVVLALEPSTTPDPDAIATAAPGTETRSTADYAATMEATVDEGFLPVVGALVAIGLAIGGAVVALTTYTATVERARDFAVLKALGASGWFVYRVVIRQSIVLGLVGSSVGLGAAGFVAAFVRRTVPEFLTDLRWGDALAVSALTLAVSLLAAYLPVRRIDRIDPALVFRA